MGCMVPVEAIGVVVEEHLRGHADVETGLEVNWRQVAVAPYHVDVLDHRTVGVVLQSVVEHVVALPRVEHHCKLLLGTYVLMEHLLCE